jgi:hypothetical protein
LFGSDGWGAASNAVTATNATHRVILKRPRRGHQWTRKVEQKHHPALSRDQYESLKKAVANERRLWNTIEKMMQISLRILFGSLPDTHRCKRLGNKILGLNQVPFGLDSDLRFAKIFVRMSDLDTYIRVRSSGSI